MTRLAVRAFLWAVLPLVVLHLVLFRTDYGPAERWELAEERSRW